MLLYYVTSYNYTKRITGEQDTGVCETNTSFTHALAMRPGGRSCNSAPDLVLSKLIFQLVFLSGGVSFSQTPVSVHAVHNAHIVRDGIILYQTVSYILYTHLHNHMHRLDV